MSWQRARSVEQKAERVRAIEDSAARLFLDRPYHEISMGQIAELAGFTRPNLYRYFASKEEIFLSLLSRDLDAWIGDIQASVADLDVPVADVGAPVADVAAPVASSPARATNPSSWRDSPASARIEAFASWWVTRFLDQPRLPRLLPLMSTSLEENTSEENLRAFKRRLLEQVSVIGRVVQAALPWFDETLVPEFANTQLALVTGFMPMATRGEIHERVLDEPALRPFAIRFEESYRTTLVSWLVGVRSRP